MAKRVFLIVLDSMGIGEMPDASLWHDERSNTLGAIRNHPAFSCPNLESLGLFDIDGNGGSNVAPKGSYARMSEASMGKDTTTGHWEIAGIVSKTPFPTYPDGFPADVIGQFEKKTGRKVICNKPYSGLDVIRDYGEEQMRDGSLIVYTSADSVFQIAAHEDVISPKELYRYCEIARGILVGAHGVGRVIARPFAGRHPFVRTAGRHDYSLEPPQETMLDLLKKGNKQVISVGKISDIFAGRGITSAYRTADNAEGMKTALSIAEKDFEGLCFINLVDFDMVYGHRNNVAGYAAAMTEFDLWLGDFLLGMRRDDVVIITADHGCDPSTPSTDHSREYTPMLICGESIQSGINLGTRDTFSDIGQTVLEYLGVDGHRLAGKSFLSEVLKKEYLS